jgi:hypothetical protein
MPTACPCAALALNNHLRLDAWQQEVEAELTAWDELRFALVLDASIIKLARHYLFKVTGQVAVLTKPKLKFDLQKIDAQLFVIGRRHRILDITRSTPSAPVLYLYIGLTVAPSHTRKSLIYNNIYCPLIYRRNIYRRNRRKNP